MTSSFPDNLKRLVSLAESEDLPRDESGSRFLVENVVDKPSNRFQMDESSGLCKNFCQEVTPDRVVQFSVGESNDHLRQNSTSTLDNVTLNHKSWRNVHTLEKPPIIDFYRNQIDIGSGISQRPSMLQLIHGASNRSSHAELVQFKSDNDEIVQAQVLKNSELENFQPPVNVSRVKFGWIQGVFVRCILNILGVMLYLRISWVVGQAGIGMGSLIVLLASLVTTITTFSMCAICTNGDVKGGGAYFLISRSLGPEFGGSIGLIFSVANSVGAAMYVVGFAETVRDLMNDLNLRIVDNELMDVRIIGLVTCTVLMCIVWVGANFESRMQLVLLVVLLISMINYWLGTLIGPNQEQKIRGITGYKLSTFTSNLAPSFSFNLDFFSVFAVFFPAATGIMAGANLSGDLADPQTAIPKGTLTAILTTTGIYLSTVWMTGATCLREADGSASDWSISPPDCSTNQTCPFGLKNSFQVMKTESWWAPLITAGIFAATLSSALANLISAPKVFQAVCKDRLYPYIHYFAKGYGNEEEPRRAYGLGFSIAMLIILIGDLNAIAPIISNFFLASYALINYACFDASFADSPGFRPSFKYYNMWVSLVGALLCLSVMFIISWWTALITFLFFALLFTYILHRKPDVNWGSSTQAHSYRAALQGMLRLTATEEHIKNFRPQFLVLTGNPASRPSLVDFVYNISKGSSLMVCGHVVPYCPCEPVLSFVRQMDRQLNDWLQKRRVKAFYVPVASVHLRTGVQMLLQTAGMGKLRPNIVVLGFKCDWTKLGVHGLAQINEYFGLIQDAFDSNMGVGILRNSDEGLDYSELMKEHNVGDTNKLKMPEVDTVLNGKIDIDSHKPMVDIGRNSTQIGNKPNSSNFFAEKLPFLDDDVDDQDCDEKEGKKHLQKFPKEQRPSSTSPPPSTVLLSIRSRRTTAAQRDLLTSINRFQRKRKNATVDVWWLYDDGGLTLLVPHLLTVPKSYLENAKMRIFTIASSRSAIEQEQRSMAALLSKFRIEFTDVFVLPDVARKPLNSTQEEFAALIEPFMEDDKTGMDNSGTRKHNEGLISGIELSSQRDRTNRQLRCRELLLQHSSDASLLVITLPVPRKGLLSSCLYMSWLEMLTRNLPPTLLIRGNQTSVLTFYS